MPPNTPPATSVGVGLSSHDAYAGNPSSHSMLGRHGGALSPRRAIETVKGILQSPQFIDGVRLFAIGAAVSASKMVMDAVLTAAKRLLFGEATFCNRDEAYRWMLLLMMTQPAFRKSPRAVEVTTRPTLLADYEADYRGMMNEDELSNTWSDLQPRGGDDVPEKDATTSTSNDEKSSSRSDGEAHSATSGAGIGVHMFPATGESIHFVHEGTHFWASRRRELVGDTSWEELISISYLSMSSTPLRRIIQHAKEEYQRVSSGRVSIRRVGAYGGWVESGGVAKRSADSVHLPAGVKEKLLDDAKRFASSPTRRWYGDRGIPYRRGYLLHGKPGSGKSSMCHALASELERPIYALSLATPSLNEQTLLERMSEIPSGSIVLIEDVDAAFGSPDAASEDVSEPSKRSKPNGTSAKRAASTSLSFSGLLNAIDGIGAAEGRILCMTTNHVERLDPALVRPGRVDLQFRFDDATPKQAQELFLRWYSPRGTSIANGPEQEAVGRAARDFSQRIPANIVSVAAIQGFLLTCGTDWRKALSEVDGWIKSQRDAA